MSITTTAYDLAKRFMGLREVAGSTSNPQVLSMLRLDTAWPSDDEVPWCSAFVNYIAWLLMLPRSKNLAARSWLTIGQPIELAEAVTDADVVVLKRGGENQPGPEVIQAQGHVGFFAGLTPDGKRVQVLGGNQGDSVSIQAFPIDRVLGVRRLV